MIVVGGEAVVVAPLVANPIPIQSESPCACAGFTSRLSVIGPSPDPGSYATNPLCTSLDWPWRIAPSAVNRSEGLALQVSPPTSVCVWSRASPALVSVPSTSKASAISGSAWAAVLAAARQAISPRPVR